MKIEGIGFCTYSKHPMSIDEATCKFKDKRCLTCRYFVSKEEFVTVEEASEIIGRCQATIRKYIKQGKLEAFKHSYTQRFGRKTYKTEFWIIRRKSIEEFKRSMK